MHFSKIASSHVLEDGNHNSFGNFSALHALFNVTIFDVHPSVSDFSKKHTDFDVIHQLDASTIRELLTD